MTILIPKVTLQQAYDILKKYHKGQKLLSACENSRVYVMSFVPEDTPDDELYLGGAMFPCVDKLTGKVGVFDMSKNAGFLSRCKPVNISTIKR